VDESIHLFWIVLIEHHGMMPVSIKISSDAMDAKRRRHPSMGEEISAGKRSAQ